MPVSQEELEIRFTYHRPKGDQGDRYEAIRDKAHEFAAMIVRVAPDSRELHLALSNLEQSVMWANAAIARREP